MRTKDKRKEIIILFVSIILTIGLCWIIVDPVVQLSPGKGLDRSVYKNSDSTLIENRHIGYINYKKFVNLINSVLPQMCTIEYINQGNDSVHFKMNESFYYYIFGQNDEWVKKYQNMPICIKKDGFIAKTEIKNDSVRYVYIPYQILSNVAKLGEKNSSFDDGVSETPRQTISQKTILPDPRETKGNKIQTEGIVRQNVVDILSKHPHMTKRQQLETLWRHAKDNWNYLNDPYTETDTWRPASETISDYYLVNGKCYTGDCDDFAILMASFARQIGYQSHFVVSYNQNEGHAYAEFKDGNRWIPLDWFSDNFGGRPFQGTNKIIYDNL